jgi:hypothetical protein
MSLLSPSALIEFASADPGYGKNEELWSEILPGLWMGGTADRDEIAASSPTPHIKPNHFDTVVTLYGHAKPVDWYVKELRLAFYDHNEVDVDHHDLRQLVSSAHRDWQQGKRVLVRCQAGWNRSGLIMALILIKDGLTPSQAIDLIRNRRSDQALCNRSFVNWLLTEAEAVLEEETILPAA